MMYGWDGTGGWWMWLVMVLFWGIVIFLIVWAVKTFAGNTGGSGSGSRSNALDIARERYAKGEISQEEFEKMKKSLS